MTLKAKDIPALFYPWHSLSEVQDELQKDFIWQITKQQDSGTPQVAQTESLHSQFKTSTLNKEGVKLEGIILSCTMPTMGFGSALYLASCGGVSNGRTTPCAFAKNQNLISHKDRRSSTHQRLLTALAFDWSELELLLHYSDPNKWSPANGSS